MRKFSKRVALIGLALSALAPVARADVVYTFIELFATIDGTPADAGAVGKIVLTDAGFASGSVSVSTDQVGDVHLDGVVSASFGTLNFLPGPIVGTPSQDVNFTATVSGRFLDVDGFFFETLSEEDQYREVDVPFPHLLTINYGTDNQAEPCSPNAQGSGTGICLVTGFFFNLTSIPEPTSLSVLLFALSAFALLGIARTRKERSTTLVS